MLLKRIILYLVEQVGDNNNIFCGRLPIKQVFEIRYLGFYLDNNISWKKHCSVIGAKISRGLGILRRVKITFQLKILKIIYFTRVHRYID